VVIAQPVASGGLPEPISHLTRTETSIMTSSQALDNDRSFDTYESIDDNEVDRPAAVDPVRSAPIVAALERAWDAIRHRHAELPRVVMVVASGSDGAPAGWLKLGHFAAMRWQTGEGLLPEVFVGGEGLAAGPTAVLGTLLHEAAHAIAEVRGIKDTSRQGRYHNQRYADLARILGLDVTQVAPIGWSGTSVPEATAATYADTIKDLTEALTIFRHPESGQFAAGDPSDDTAHGGDRTRTRRPRRPGAGSSGNGLSCTCECGRRIRVAPSVLAAGEITCEICGTGFASIG
jgi:hypothetical protein